MLEMEEVVSVMECIQGGLVGDQGDVVLLHVECCSVEAEYFVGG